MLVHTDRQEFGKDRIKAMQGIIETAFDAIYIRPIVIKGCIHYMIQMMQAFFHIILKNCDLLWQPLIHIVVILALP